MDNDFKCKIAQTVEFQGKAAVVKASVYRSSQEDRLRAANLNPALLRYYDVTFLGETASMLLSEVELNVLLGRENFENLL